MSEPATPTFSIAAFFRYAISRASQSAVAWSLFATAVRLLSGVLVLPLIVRILPSDHLGLWYVFLSLQGIAALFDLGFSPAVTRAAGYLWGGAQQLRKFGVANLETSERANPQPNYQLLTSLVATMRLYYRFFGIGSGLIMLVVGGAWIWIKTQNFPDAASLRACYAVFVFGGFLNATGDLWPALLSVINGVRAAQKILVGSAFINLVTIVGGLLAHLGIWSLVIATVGAGAFIRWAGRAAFFQLATAKLNRQSRPDFHLIGTLWPTAWRSGLVSLGGFLVISANTLICSAFLDLKRTASYGLSLSLIAILTYASSSFIQIKLPLINQLRATNQTSEIVELWIQRTRISIVFFVFGALLLLSFGNFALETIGAKTLLLPKPQLALALLIFGLEMHHSLYAGLIISENQNPFVAPSLLSGSATLVLSLVLTPRLGVWGMLLAQGLAQACFNNWWPVYRAIRGLGIPWTEYWRNYVRTPIRI
jgi:O-antigen/teichoic acid export membrane protein